MQALYILHGPKFMYLYINEVVLFPFGSCVHMLVVWVCMCDFWLPFFTSCTSTSKPPLCIT